MSEITALTDDELNTVKNRNGISADVTAYDAEISSLALSGKTEMSNAGASDDFMKTPMGINALAFYVKAHLQVDEQGNSDKCMKRFWELTRTLVLDTEIAEAEALEETT